MRASQADILIIPGWSGSDDDHWQSRWQRNFKTARRVEQEDWFEPDLASWQSRIEKAVAEASKPVVIVAHSLGAATTAHAASSLPKDKVAGAYLVAPADVDNADKWPITQGYDPTVALKGFAPMPCERFPFPSMLVASSNDPYCTIERAREISEHWGAQLIEAGESGHLNIASGHGPWPEGLLRFGLFMKELG